MLIEDDSTLRKIGNTLSIFLHAMKDDIRALISIGWILDSLCKCALLHLTDPLLLDIYFKIVLGHLTHMGSSQYNLPYLTLYFEPLMDYTFLGTDLKDCATEEEIGILLVS